MFPILSRNQIKFIRSLKQKKNRYKFKNYVVEGEKLIMDLVRHRPSLIQYIVIDDGIRHLSFPDGISVYQSDHHSFLELSNLVTPQGVMAVCAIPDHYFRSIQRNHAFGLYFDGVQDPGNLGTMLRAAEWFGVPHILIGPGTADPFSPKVVQAAMGSHSYLTMVKCSHQELSETSGAIISAVMDGEDAFEYAWPRTGVLVLGNEGQGISATVARLSTNRITLPAAAGAQTESLNVSMACTSLLTLRHKYQQSNKQMRL
ncbi:hypothetical protein KUV50_11665 [Membranicola marinus]|uniref:RNA 2-O ribose methyltransferase substrate binding domain-containing protein n=1 Tax=Membranihabitans marinus TaxID=1227546 RepID=A0A953L7J9_9BACT|nr:TrmH family RNA methyltransferase [Membranihabitans marinus]MBY5958797.1 hypothetical protein [Membranihabitans marinus]